MSRVRSLAIFCLLPTLLIASQAPDTKPAATPGERGSAPVSLDGEPFPLVADLQGQNTSLLSLAFSPDGATLAAAGDKGLIELWKVADWQSSGILSGHTATINSLAFSSDGAQLASGSDDATVRVWDPANQSELSQFKPTMATNVYRVVFSPSGSELAVGAQMCVVQLVNPGSGILRRTLDQPGCGSTSFGWVRAWGIDYFPDSEGLVTGDGRGCCGGALFRWDEDRFVEPQLLVGYGLPVNEVVIDPSGTRVALSALGEPAVWIRDAASGALIHEMIGHVFRVTALAFSPDGKLVASVSRDGALVLWDAEAGVEATRLTPKAGPLTDVAFSPDGRLLAASTESGRVLVWDRSGG
jgi:WD40 repeat protein